MVYSAHRSCARFIVRRSQQLRLNVPGEETGALLPAPPPTLRAQDGRGLNLYISSLLQLFFRLPFRLPSVLPPGEPNSKPSHSESPDANVFLHITDQVCISKVCQVTAAQLSARLSVPPPRPRSPTGWRRSHHSGGNGDAGEGRQQGNRRWSGKEQGDGQQRRWRDDGWQQLYRKTFPACPRRRYHDGSSSSSSTSFCTRRIYASSERHHRGAAEGQE